MADRFGVAARLAEGRPAVEHTQSYVWACHRLGYQHPDLTAHAGQVLDWYRGEDGLDLHALDGDCAELWAAVAATEEALRIQRAQIGQLAAAWAGPGADSAIAFLQRHCAAGEAVAAAVRAAAEGCGALRDNLWQLVDARVATAIAIDDRRLAQRPGWLAAARSVGDSSADELVFRQVMPYVDNDIRTDWLTAMRSTAASVAASYDAATDGLTAAPVARFEIPGDLGPSRPVPDDPSAMAAAPVVPAAVSPTPPPEAVASAAPPASELGAPLGDAAGTAAGAGEPGGLGGLEALASRIVAAIGGLVGSLTEGLADPSGIDDAPADDPDAVTVADETTGDKDATTEAAGEELPAAAEVVDDVTAEPAPTPPDAPPPDTGLSPDSPSPAPSPDGSTPCEIAADELPQAGQ